MRVASVTLLFVASLSVSEVAGQTTFPDVTPQATQTIKAAGFDIDVFGDLKGFTLASDTKRVAEGVDVLALTLRSATAAPPPRFSLRWSIPSHDVAGHWMTGRHQNKTIRPDWAGSRLQASMLAREAPVSCLFSSDNKNVLTFAVSDALNTISTGSGVREEDGMIYNDVIFFAERHKALTEYTVEAAHRPPLGSVRGRAAKTSRHGGRPCRRMPRRPRPSPRACPSTPLGTTITRTSTPPSC